MSGGLFGECFDYSGGPSPTPHDQLITPSGSTTPLPSILALRPAWFPGPGATVVALGTVTPSGAPVAAAIKLLVVRPQPWTVTNAITISDTQISDPPSLFGVTGDTALVLVPSGATEQIMAYDLNGTRLWDVALGGSQNDPAIAVTSAGVLYSVPISPFASTVALLDLSNGAVKWTATRPVGLSQTGTTSAVGLSVFYDANGAAWSLNTGATAGPGASAYAPTTGLQFGVNAVTYQNDLVMSDPFIRVTPEGNQVWSVALTTGEVAADGQVLLAMDDSGIVDDLNPATGTTAAQAHQRAGPFVSNCQPELTVAGADVVAAGIGAGTVPNAGCINGSTEVYTVTGS